MHAPLKTSICRTSSFQKIVLGATQVSAGMRQLKLLRSRVFRGLSKVDTKLQASVVSARQGITSLRPLFLVKAWMAAVPQPPLR